jgi:hypothetical protein
MITFYCPRSPQLGGSGPRIYILRTTVAQLYPQALGSLFVASYDSLGYGGRQRQNQSYFTTGGLLPISSSWGQAPWDSRSEFFFQPSPCGDSPYEIYSLTRRWGFILWICLAFRHALRIALIACYWKFFFLHYTCTGPLSVQALQSRSCLSYVSYATTAA